MNTFLDTFIDSINITRILDVILGISWIRGFPFWEWKRIAILFCKKMEKAPPPVLQDHQTRPSLLSGRSLDEFFFFFFLPKKKEVIVGKGIEKEKRKLENETSMPIDSMRGN